MYQSRINHGANGAMAQAPARNNRNFSQRWKAENGF